MGEQNAEQDAWVGVKKQRTRRSKSERFRIDAEKHATRALAQMKKLEGLADSRHFDWQDADADQLVEALQAGVVRIAEAFQAAREGEVEPRFRFGE